MPKHSLVTIIALIVSASIALTFAIFNLDQLQPKSDTGPGLRFENKTFFRSISPFGHHLGIMASYGGSEALVSVGNPSGYEFKDCNLILDTATGEIANTTLKTYDRILPDSYDYFTAELEGSNNGNAPSWLILECKEPYELATTPRIFLGKLDYMTGENVTIKGMVGFSEVTLRVLDADGNTILEKKLPTNNGFLQFSFLVPDDAKPGTWSVQLESFSETYGQDFRVVVKSQG